MRRSLAPALTIAAATLVALVFLVLAAAPTTANDDPSSRAAGRAGTLALHQWLSSLGFATHRVSGSFSTVGTDVLFMVDPTVAVTEMDTVSVLHFLRGGGDLILAVSPGRAPLAGSLLSALGVSLDVPHGAGDSVPAQPIDAGNRVQRLPMAAGLGIDPSPQVTPLLVQGSVLTAAEVMPAGGGGRAYVLSSPLPLTNDGLRRADSSMFVLTMLGRARGGALAFDEYHHGEQDAVAGGAAAVFGGPLGLALGLAVAAVLLYLATSGRRLGRPLPVNDAGLVPSTASYVEAMAGLFARSRDRGGVATRYADELKQRIGPLTGVDPRLPDEAFTAAVAQSAHPGSRSIAPTLARARALAASAPNAGALLALARDIDDLEAAWAQLPATPATAQ